MGKIPEGAPIAWVLGPDQKFVEVRPPSRGRPLGCSNCGACDGEEEEDQRGFEPPLLHRNDVTGMHTCVICGSDIEHDDVTILLTKWVKPPSQRRSFPLVGAHRLAHFSCGVMDTLDFAKMQDQKVRALQRVDKRLSAKTWIRSHKKFRSILMEETKKLLEEEKQRDSERSRLLRIYQKAEKRARKEE